MKLDHRPLKIQGIFFQWEDIFFVAVKSSWDLGFWIFPPVQIHPPVSHSVNSCQFENTLSCYLLKEITLSSIMIKNQMHFTYIFSTPPLKVVGGRESKDGRGYLWKSYFSTYFYVALVLTTHQLRTGDNCSCSGEIKDYICLSWIHIWSICRSLSPLVVSNTCMIDCLILWVLQWEITSIANTKSLLK